MKLANMRNICVLLMLLFLITAVSAKANDFVEQRVKKLQSELNLSEEQTGQVRQVLAYNYEQAQKEREENQGNPEALMNAAKARQEMTARQIKNMLTAEQYEKYQEISKNAVVDNAVLRLKERLNLTDEQTELVEAIMASTRDEMRKLHESGSGDRRQSMMQGRQIMENQDKQIEALLTDAQKKIYEEVKKERREEMRKRMHEEGRGPQGGPPGGGHGW